MRRKTIIFFIFLILSVSATEAQTVLRLQDCKQLALDNNIRLQIGKETIKRATAEKKGAFTHFLPDISLKGAYLYNSRNLSLLSDNAMLPVYSMGATGLTPTTSVAIIPKEAFEFDTHNIFIGAVSLMQPIFMGGKILAANKMAAYARQLAESQHNTDTRSVTVEVEKAYWGTVSLVHKQRLAEKYVAMLRQMDSDMQEMLKEGVATRSDGLSVRVKLNEAEMRLTQAANGVQLSRMALCRLCGLPLNEQIVLADERTEPDALVVATEEPSSHGNMSEVFSNRTELTSLELATKIYRKKEAIARADMLPTIALAGNYMVTNPNTFNGYAKKFAGQWNVGVTVSIPLFHWGETFRKVQAAKAETRIRELEVADAQNKIELQVNQAVFKLNEARKQFVAAQNNKENADENLRYATLGFEEGVISALNVMEAQTAWFQAESERIDAHIAVMLGQTELNNALGKKL
jgi:outer membrane protein TolC